MASFLPDVIKLNRRYKLLEKRQRIILAVSGGVDSLAIARTLWEYRKTIDPELGLQAVYVKIDQISLTEVEIERIRDFLSGMNIPLMVVPGKLDKVKTVSCYACARERRKRLFFVAADQHIDTVAFGHNLDDYMETGFLNLVHGGHLESLQPRQSMFKGEITVIRPLLSVSKKHIGHLAKYHQFPKVQSECPYASDNRRESIRKTMRELQRLNRAFLPNLRNAINRWNDLAI